MYNPGVFNGLRPSVSLTAATTLTAQDSGRLYDLNLATGFTVTLPVLVAGATMWFEFVVGTATSSGGYIIAAASGTPIHGTVHSSTGGNADSTAGTGTAVITFATAADTVGDRVIIHSNPAGTIWYATCFCDADTGITFD